MLLLNENIFMCKGNISFKSLNSLLVKNVVNLNTMNALNLVAISNKLAYVLLKSLST